MEALLGSLVKILNSPIIQEELGLLRGIETEIQKLSSLLSTTKAVIEDAEQKQFTDKAIQLWLQELNLIAYEVDDILDDYATEVSREPSNVLDCLPATSNIWFRHRIGAMMKKIIGKFDAVAYKQKMFNLSDQKRGSYFNASRETGSVVNEPEVLGRDNEKRHIVRILTKEKDRVDQNVSVLPIVGVGGLGKTTLAQLVFNDERIAEHFEPKLWVWVSEDFDGKRIIKALINSIQQTPTEASDLDPLQRNLQELLRGKRYLIVLDDVWNENPQEWEDLKSVLACGSSGSSTVVTTRKQKVAEIMGTLETHRLSSLSDDQCWSLFRQRAFDCQQNQERLEAIGRERAFDCQEKEERLEAVGKEIVKKCGGVPLAAKALGGFLRFKSEAEWNSVKCSELWNLPEDETGILPALGLSYLNLPVELRGCFAYCAVFPKGYEIEKEEVIRLWMANGLISSNGTMEVEDVGAAAVTELHHRSLFQAVEKDDHTFKMHDLVHDLAQSVMKAKHGGTESIRTMELFIAKYQLRVDFPITSAGIDQFSSLLSNCGSLRALIVRSRRWTSEHLRVYNIAVLRMEAKHFMKFLCAVSKLKHLRHLNLSASLIVELPNSICDLWNLQILNLNDCEFLRSLPKGMRFLRNLRHLCLQGCGSLTHMPSGIGKLTSLRTLSMVVLGGKSGFQLSELRGLNNLREELTIEHLERVEDKKHAEEACLIRKQGLRKLHLNWDSGRMFQQCNDEEVLEAQEVLEALEPSPNLQRLHIRGFKGSSFPSWISLKQLELENCPNLKGMLGREVQGTPGVFSQLQSLSFRDCPTLTLPLPRMPSLKRLHILECPNMAWASISNLTSLNSLEIVGIKGLSCFPEEMLQNLSLLESLDIREMMDLRALPRSLASLTALKTLSIKFCAELESLPEEGLRGLASLHELHLFSCRNLVSLSMGTKALKSLTHLSIKGSNATALPEEVKHFPALQELVLENFPNLTSLPDWFGDHLTSLRHLTLWDCPKLGTLPSSIQMMTTLQSLTINYCKLLGPRCERGGEKWHKIKHIPFLDLKIASYNYI